MTDMKYRGRGRFLVGVPARDLTSDEVARLPEHLRRRMSASGLYEAVKPPKAEKGVTAHE